MTVPDIPCKNGRDDASKTPVSKTHLTPHSEGIGEFLDAILRGRIKEK